jgi:hypothetical protein
MKGVTTMTNIFKFYDLNAKPILAMFKNGQCNEYTTNIINLLKTDSEVEYIVDGTTGEVIYINEK